MSFHSDINIGQKGENIIYDYLMNHPSTDNVINVSNDKWFQQFDIDFVQINGSGDVNKIEVKTDRLAHKTGNMVYEIWSDRRIYSKGCFEKTEADYIFYFLINTNIIYIFDTLELRDWVKKHETKLNRTNMGDYAVGYLIPLNDLKEICIKVKL